MIGFIDLILFMIVSMCKQNQLRRIVYTSVNNWNVSRRLTGQFSSPSDLSFRSSRWISGCFYHYLKVCSLIFTFNFIYSHYHQYCESGVKCSWLLLLNYLFIDERESFWFHISSHWDDSTLLWCRHVFVV